jgi:phosphohistidine phosphatase
MKRLTLIRHANADWKEGNGPDAERPLSPRGLAEAEALARLLLRHDLIPDLLLVSPARRTSQTAEILARGLSMPADHVRPIAKLYLASAGEILHLAQTTAPSNVGHVAMVGHNPGLSELLRRLAPADAAVIELSTAAACSLTFAVADWSGISGTATQMTFLQANKVSGAISTPAR